MKHVLDDFAPGSVHTPAVYVLDDDPAVVEALVFSLEANGRRAYGHTEADSLLAALVREGEPCVLLTDILMPGLDGVSVARRARSLSPDLTVILMSASSEAVASVPSEWSEKIPVLQKPFDIRELLRRL